MKAPVPKDTYLISSMIVGLVIIVVISSIGTYLFRTTLYSTKQPFSELYFDHPNMLPAQVRINERYNFSYVVANKEYKTKEYTLKTTLDLYELYDEVESQYSCLAKYRKKYFMTWENSSKIINLPQRVSYISPLTMPPGREATNWSTYSIDFKLGSILDSGFFSLYFVNATHDVVFSIGLDQDQNLTYVNGEFIQKGFSLNHQNNDITVSYDNGSVTLFINNEEHIQTNANIKDTQFGFYTQDGYFSVSQLAKYKTKRYVVPDDNTIINFDVRDQLLFNSYYELRKLNRKSVTMLRTFTVYNQTINCQQEPFYCIYFDLPNDITFYLKESNLSKIIHKIPSANPRLNYELAPIDKDTATIDWRSYNVSIVHSDVGEDGAFIFRMGELWAIMITRNNAYFMVSQFDGTTIDEFKNPSYNNQSGNISIYVDRNAITLYKDQKKVFTKTTPNQYTNAIPSIFVKSSLVVFDPVLINNEDTRCEENRLDVYCTLELPQFRGGQQIRPPESAPDYTYQITEYDDRAAMTYSSNFSINSSNASIQNLFRPLAQVELLNPYIADQLFVFDSSPMRMINETNGSLLFTYDVYDGTRIFELGLRDDHAQIAWIIDEYDNSFEIIYDFQNDSLLFDKQYFFNKTTVQQLNMDLNDGNLSFNIKGKKLFQIDGLEFDNAFWYLKTYGTYARGDVVASNNNVLRRASLQQDQCELSKIFQEVSTEKVTMQHGQVQHFFKEFNIAQEFDYAKVQVELYNSTNTTLSIHFWVQRE